MGLSRITNNNNHSSINTQINYQQSQYIHTNIYLKPHFEKCRFSLVYEKIRYRCKIAYIEEDDFKEPRWN